MIVRDRTIRNGALWRDLPDASRRNIYPGWRDARGSKILDDVVRTMKTVRPGDVEPEPSRAPDDPWASVPATLADMVHLAKIAGALGLAPSVGPDAFTAPDSSPEYVAVLRDTSELIAIVSSLDPDARSEILADARRCAPGPRATEK